MKYVDFNDADPDSSGREKWLTGIRLFKDQLEKLDWLIVHKYHNNRTKSALVRDALDQFIEREKNAR
jgi:predicted DNA-binding protein